MLPEGVQQWNVYHGEGEIFFVNFLQLKAKTQNRGKRCISIFNNTAFSSFANYGIPSLSAKRSAITVCNSNRASYVMTDHYKHKNKFSVRVMVHKPYNFCHGKLSAFQISFDFLP